jgi:hypothetical protein
MVLQFEDMVDCLKFLYPQYDYYFMFDQSNGFDRIRPDGLNVNKISKHFGGSQLKMRDTVITEENLGPYNAGEY